MEGRHLPQAHNKGEKEIMLEIKIDCIPNQIILHDNEVVKGGFVFNTGSNETYIRVNDLIYQMGTIENYSMSFPNPITYKGFIYFKKGDIPFQQEDNNILLLFQDLHDREYSRNKEVSRFKCFVYNGVKSIYCYTTQEDKVKNIYMNKIQFILEDVKPGKPIQESKPIQLDLFMV